MTNLIFSTEYDDIIASIKKVDPIAYGRTRNFINGAVSALSPYISRGVISTRQVMTHLMQKGYKFYQIEKFLQELAWRDYFQRVAMERPNLLTQDLKNPQPRADHHDMPLSVMEAHTGIKALDTAIQGLYDTGYMHNHCRMYTASVVCNIARCQWQVPAQWMYYHLLDADFASNACSWQWVSGAFSNKLYFADQHNVNKYCHTDQKGTFLDLSYEEIASMPIPEILLRREPFLAQTFLPETKIPEINPDKPVLIYNAYNLDPIWRKDDDANRILLLEPSHFKRLPVSGRTIQFIIDLSRNIPGIVLFVGEFEALKGMAGSADIIFREHPLFRHYQGTTDPREWMFPEISGFHNSFFSYWKKCEQLLKKM